MEDEHDNPLLPLRAVGLSEQRKELLWNEIVQQAYQGPSEGSSSAKVSRRRWVAYAPLAVLGTAALVGFTNPQLLNWFNSPPQVAQGISLGYGEKVHESTTSHGITLTIDELYADPTQLEFGMVESFANGQSDHPVINDGDIHLTISGDRALTGFSGGQFERLSDGRYAGVVYFPVMNDLPYTPLPDIFTLKVQTRRIGSVDGNWTFSIPVSQLKLRDHTRTILTDTTVQSGGNRMRVTQVTMSPVQTVIEATLTLARHEPLPEGMQVVDNTGHVIGAGIAYEQTVKLTQSERVVHVIMVGNAARKATSALTVTPVRDVTSPAVALQGSFPKWFQPLPGLTASVLGVRDGGHRIVVDIVMNQARYRRELLDVPYREAQFVLVGVSASGRGEVMVGSQGVQFASPTSDRARIVFDEVSTSTAEWKLENEYRQTMTALQARVTLP